MDPTATRLFDSYERTRIASRRHGEGTYGFLNSSAWPSMERLRDYWEEWFAQYEGDKKDLAARFGSPIEHAYLSAFVELFTFAILKRSAYDVAVAPAAKNYALDFLASRDNGVSFYVECTATGQSAADAAADVRKAKVFDAIQEIPTWTFVLGVNVESSGASDVPLRALRPAFSRWIASLPQGPNVDQENRWEWESDGWRIAFWATPIDGEGGLGMIGPDIFDAHEQAIRLRRAINEKASKYGALDRPLLIVTNSIQHQSERDLTLAVVGDYDYQVNTVTRDVSIRRKPNGVFVNTKGPRNVNMSAVMHGNFGAITFTRDNPDLRIVQHPYAAQPLPRGLFPFCEEWHYDAEGAGVVTPASISLADFLGFPEGWPYFDQDPK